jgi:hypothetical protein
MAGANSSVLGPAGHVSAVAVTEKEALARIKSLKTSGIKG